MFKKNSKYGFTLIELLVVVAVIGILSSVVLASLNSARSKANFSAAKSELSSMRAEAELLWSDKGNYNKVCDSNPSGTDANPNALYQSASANVSDATCVDGDVNTGKWAAWISDNGNAFCVDYTGEAIATASATISSSGECTDNS